MVSLFWADGNHVQTVPLPFSPAKCTRRSRPGVRPVGCWAGARAAPRRPVPGCDLGSSGGPLASPARGGGPRAAVGSFSGPDGSQMAAGPQVRARFPRAGVTRADLRGYL